MSKISNYKDLEVWKIARTLVKDIYILTKSYPKDELFALVSQTRRAVISVPANIAEGFSRHGTKDYIAFISIAIGSLAELETLLILAEDVGYIAATKELDKINQLQRMLQSLRKSLKEKL